MKQGAQQAHTDDTLQRHIANTYHACTYCGAMAGSLPMYVGIGFYMFTGNSSVLMVLTGISLGIMANFRPATLFGTA